MKTKSIILTFACMAVLGARADEGMWTLYNLPNAVYEKMRLEGYQLPYDKLYQADDAIMNESAIFGRCFATDDQKQGMKAFLEKGKYEFQGK